MSDNTFNITSYLNRFAILFPSLQNDLPWNITHTLESVLRKKLKILSSDFDVRGEIAVHKTARIEEGVTLKGPIIISANTFIGAHAYLRAGVFLDDHALIGPGCEVKTSIIMQNSCLAHFNFVGDSLIGSNVNMEAGSVIANHYNERPDKTISVIMNATRTNINVHKFGALVGDKTKIGANAVLSPGTILEPDAVVPRLGLIEQDMSNNLLP